MSNMPFLPFLIILLIRLLIASLKSEKEADHNASKEGNPKEPPPPPPKPPPPPRKRTKPKIQGLFDECTTSMEVKKRFRRLSMLNHPDRGGSPKAMKTIIAQYEEALLRLKSEK